MVEGTVARPRGDGDRAIALPITRRRRPLKADQNVAVAPASASASLSVMSTVTTVKQRGARITLVIAALAALGVVAAPAVADKKVVLKLKSHPAVPIKMDMNKDGGGMGAGDMVVYQPVSLYTLQGRKVGQRGVFTSIISGQPGAATSMAYSTVNLYFGGGNAIYETLYAPGHFNASVPLKDGEVWRRAIVGGTGKYMGARGEDVVQYKGDWVYFQLTMYLPGK